MTRMGSSHGRRRLSWRRVPTRPIPARRFCRNPAADRFMGDAYLFPGWAAEAIGWLRDQAVMEGDNYGNFLPQGHLTREQAILIFYRLAREVSIPETGLVPYEEELTRALDDFTPAEQLESKAAAALLGTDADGRPSPPGGARDRRTDRAVWQAGGGKFRASRR